MAENSNYKNFQSMGMGGFHPQPPWGYQYSYGALSSSPSGSYTSPGPNLIFGTGNPAQFQFTPPQFQFNPGQVPFNTGGVPLLCIYMLPGPGMFPMTMTGPAPFAPPQTSGSFPTQMIDAERSNLENYLQYLKYQQVLIGRQLDQIVAEQQKIQMEIKRMSTIDTTGEKKEEPQKKE